MLNGLLQLDVTAYLWLNRLQKNERFLRFVRLVSHSGDGYLYALLGVVVYFTTPLHYAEFIKVGLVAFLIEIPCFITLKALIKRDRPFVQLSNCDFAIQPSDKFSMPSGHTAAAFLMAGLVSLYYPEFGVLAYGWASLIGASRVLLGVHYPSDVLAGAALGSSSVLLSLALFL